MKKKRVSLITLVATILVIFILAVIIVKSLNNDGIASSLAGSKDKETEKSELQITEVKDNVAFNIEKEEYNSINDIIYYDNEFWEQRSEKTVEIIKNDLSTIAEYLKNEKNGTEILVYFTYIGDEEHVYGAVQIINGYKVGETSITIHIKEDGTIEALPFSVVNFNNQEKFVTENEMKDIIINYLVQNPEHYYESITDKGIVVTWQLTKKNEELCWMVFLNAWHRLKIYPNGTIEYIKQSEPIT